MKTTSLLTALSVLCPALALGATHSAISTRGLLAADPSTTNANVTSAELFFNWTDGSSQASGSAFLKNAANESFVFDLIAVTAPSTADSITGRWNIRKNGALVCANCAGQAYGLSGNSYFKFYGGPASNTYAYHFSAYFTNRSDY